MGYFTLPDKMLEGDSLKGLRFLSNRSSGSVRKSLYLDSYVLAKLDLPAAVRENAERAAEIKPMFWSHAPSVLLSSF